MGLGGRSRLGSSDPSPGRSHVTSHIRRTSRPDLVFLRGGLEIAVADPKYKILNEKKKLPNEDAYQLITYCTRLGLDVGHLIYAVGVDAGDDDIPLEHDIQSSPVRLAVHRVDV